MPGLSMHQSAVDTMPPATKLDSTCKGELDFVGVLVFGKLIFDGMGDGVLDGAHHFAVAVVAYDVADVVVLVKEELDCHHHKRRDRLHGGGEFCFFSELGI